MLCKHKEYNTYHCPMLEPQILLHDLYFRYDDDNKIKYTFSELSQ